MQLTKQFVLLSAMLVSTAIVGNSSFGQFLFFKKKQEADTVKKVNKYQEFIESAKCDSGVVNILTKGDDYYFEIKKDLLNRDFLIVNKISQVPYSLNDAGINKGMDFENLVVQFDYNKKENKIFALNYKPFIESSPDNFISRSVADNHGKSILESFDIEFISDDSAKYIIKVNDVYNGTRKSFNNVFGMIGVGGSAIKDFSYISSMKSYEKNVVVKSKQTARIPGAESETSITVEITSNLVLLPQKPMKPRFEDARVGYFSTQRWFYNDQQQEVEKRKLITRWNLIPKDKEAYLKGELVEPVKPIVFFIDLATPENWRVYIKQGVEMWNEAFEQAGFKNAIVCKYPDEVADFDIDDVRYSGIAYVASDKANAMGPSVVDPRSGEIIEADVVWWHNVLTAVKSWMRVQTGIIDPDSRLNDFDVEHLGDAIRFICSHEIGHTLGLRHNMGASYFYSVDSLRIPSFTEKYATAPSIMDYARFNYVAQPEDKVKFIFPQIGEYDKFAIEWAYRYYGDDDAWKEKKLGDKLIETAYKNNHCIYLPQQDMRTAVDPRAQSEDLGNNSVEASLLGITNLKRIMPQIINWTTKEGDDYQKAGELLNAVIGQWHNYSYHVLTNVGGVYINNTVMGDGKHTYEYVPENIQKQAVQYLISQVFTCPKWLFDNEIYEYVYPVKIAPNGINEYSALSWLKNSQSYIYWDLLTNERMARMLEAESQLGNKTYTALNLLSDIDNALFRKTRNSQSLDIYERASQKAFVDALIVAADRSQASKEKGNSFYEKGDMLFPSGFCRHTCCKEQEIVEQRSFDGPKRVSDAISLKRGELLHIEKLLKTKRNTGDKATQYHYEDLLLRIDQSLRK